MRGRIGPTSQPGHVGPTVPVQMIGCASPKGADHFDWPRPPWLIAIPYAQMASARLAKTPKSASLEPVALHCGNYHGADKRT